MQPLRLNAMISEKPGPRPRAVNRERELVLSLAREIAPTMRVRTKAAVADRIAGKVVERVEWIFRPPSDAAERIDAQFGTLARAFGDVAAQLALDPSIDATGWINKRRRKLFEARGWRNHYDLKALGAEDEQLKIAFRRHLARRYVDHMAHVELWR